MPLGQRLKQTLRNASKGLLVSAGVHAVVLVILGLIVFTTVRSRGENFMDFGWSPAGASSGERVDAPMALPNMPTLTTTSTTKSDANASKQQTPTESSTANSVRPANVKNILNGRSRAPDVRSRMLEQHGGNNKTEMAVDAGLEWLKRNQKAGGNWKLDDGYPDHGLSYARSDTEATALALLCFLGTGHTHQGGKYGDIVDRGLKWITSNQKPSGDFHDHAELGRETAFYAHSKAVIAVCEAYAMTGDSKLLGPAQLGVDFLLKTQQPNTGGWKFQPGNIETESDLAVTGWGLMALHTARVAGISVPDDSFFLPSHFVDLCQEVGGSRYKFEPNYPPESVTPAMSAEGLVCRQFLGWQKDHPSLIAGTRYLSSPENAPRWEDGVRDIFEWYWMGQMLHNMGGDRWKEWYNYAQQSLVPNQSKGKRTAPEDVYGTWPPQGFKKGQPYDFTEKWGRHYVTCMSILILELPYRYVSVYEDDPTPAE